MDDTGRLLDIADKIGTIGLLIAFLWGIKERWIVPGWIFTACEERSNRLEGIVNSHAQSIESKLDKLEQQERARWAGTRSHERP